MEVEKDRLMFMRIRPARRAGLLAAALLGLPQIAPAATPEGEVAVASRPRPGWMRFPARSRIDIRTLGGKTDRPIQLWTLGPKRAPISLGRFEGETPAGKNLPVGDYEKETALLFWHEYAPGEATSWAADSSQSSAYRVCPDPRGGYRVTIVDPRRAESPPLPLVSLWVRSSPLPSAPGTVASAGTGSAIQGHAPVLPVTPPMGGASAGVGVVVPAASASPAVDPTRTHVGSGTIWTKNTHFALATLSFAVSLLLFHHVMIRLRRRSGLEGRRQEIEQLLKIKDPEEALRRIESWMSIDLPPATVAFFMGYRALALFQSGSTDQAVEALDRTELNRLPLDMVTRLTDELRKAPVLPTRDPGPRVEPLVVGGDEGPRPAPFEEPLESAGIEEFLALKRDGVVRDVTPDEPGRNVIAGRFERVAADATDSGSTGEPGALIRLPVLRTATAGEKIRDASAGVTGEAGTTAPRPPEADATDEEFWSSWREIRREQQEKPHRPWDRLHQRVVVPLKRLIDALLEAIASWSPGIHWRPADPAAARPAAAPPVAPDVTEVPPAAAPPAATDPGSAPVLALEGHLLLELAVKKGEGLEASRWLERLGAPRPSEPRTRQIWSNQMALSSLTRLTRRFPPRLRGMDLMVSDPFVAVFASREPDEDRRVHVWMLSPVLATVPEIADELLRQARHFSGLTHPELLALHRAEAKPHPHFVSEAFEGRPLTEVLSRLGRLSLRDTLRVATRVAGALDYCHQRGFVHQDLRPGSIFVTETEVRLGCPILATFPVEELRRETGEVHPRAPYLSPEVLAGENPDFASDIFQLGMILHEMVSGVRPEITCLPGREGWEPASSRVPGVPDELDQVITRCLHSDPMRRYRDIGQVYELLTQLEREHRSPVRVGHSLLETLKLTGRGPLKDLARLLADWSALPDPRTLPPARLGAALDLIGGPGGLLPSLVWVVGTSSELEGQGLESLKRIAQDITAYLPYLDGLSRVRPALAGANPDTLRRALGDVEQRTTGIVQKIDELLTECSLRYRDLLEGLASGLAIPIDLEEIRPTIASHFAQVHHAQSQLAEVFRLILESSRTSGAERVVVSGESLQEGRSVRLVFREHLAHQGVQLRAPRPWSSQRRGRHLGHITRQIEDLGGTLTTTGDGDHTGIRITLPGRV